MKKTLYWIIPCCLWFAGAAVAAPGEYWEITTSMEGMGMAMPASTNKECVPLKRNDNEPVGMSGDKECTVTDIKTLPNGATWKVRCQDGTTGSGKQTSTKNSFTTDITMDRQGSTMKMHSTGKRVGGSCDAAAMEKQAAAATKQMCADQTHGPARELVGSYAGYVGKDASCADRKEEFCRIVKDDLPKDTVLYDRLQTVLKQDPQSGMVSACKWDVEGARSMLCKDNSTKSGKDWKFLRSYCPAEYQTLRANARQYTAARDYTAENAGRSSSNPANDAVNGTLEQGQKALKGLKDVFGF